MPNNGILRAQEAIEQRLERQGQPVKAGLLIKQIKEEVPGVRDMELRGAVWILIGKGKISLTPDRELTLKNLVES